MRGLVIALYKVNDVGRCAMPAGERQKVGVRSHDDEALIGGMLPDDRIRSRMTKPSRYNVL